MLYLECCTNVTYTPAIMKNGIIFRLIFRVRLILKQIRYSDQRGAAHSLQNHACRENAWTPLSMHGA